MPGQEPAPALSPTQIKKKEAWAVNEKPAQGKGAWADIACAKF